MAGVLFALLSYKPQFCVLIPVLLLAQETGAPSRLPFSPAARFC